MLTTRRWRQHDMLVVASPALPLVRAMQTIFGYSPFLRYMDSFRYPLAGEFAMQADLARVNRIPSDWGLEGGVLAESTAIVR